MQTAEQHAAGSFGSTGAEIQYYWGRLPDRLLFVGLLAAWGALFQFFGWTSTVVGRSSSLYLWMWDKWSDPANDASHGKLIPFVVLALLWWRRKRLVESVRGVWWPALFGVGLALLIHTAGYMIQQPRISMVGMFFGAWMFVGLLWGTRTLKESFFPFFVFAFCVPMGGTFAQGLTLHLRLWAAKAVEFLTKTMLDVPIQREGTRLFDPKHVFGDFDVAAECSGIRSFIALLAITTIFSVLTMKKIWKKAVMIACTIPLALICNILRVTTVVLVANAMRSREAGEFVHEWFGYVTYIIAIAGMLAMAKLLKEKPEAATHEKS